MVVADSRGSLADVHAARRALFAKFEPSLLFYVAWAAGFAFCCGSKLLLVKLVGAAVLPVGSLAATWWQSRRTRFVYPRRVRLFSRRVFLLTSVLSLLGVVAVLALTGVLAVALLRHWAWLPVIPHRGSPMAYLVPFVVFIVPVLAVVVLPWRIEPYGIDARPMRKTPDQPAAVDPVIEPRQQIMLCAMLAGVDWIEARFLASMLGVADEELHQRTAELTAAKYIDVHPHNGRWWVGLTAVGRAAYRRHLRALQRTPEGRPIVAADEFANR